MSPAAWTCTAEPVAHGSFPQQGLEMLAVVAPEMQPPNRFGCPVCFAIGQPGWLRPAEKPEAARIAAGQGV